MSELDFFSSAWLVSGLGRKLELEGLYGMATARASQRDIKLLYYSVSTYFVCWMIVMAAKLASITALFSLFRRYEALARNF